MNHLTTKDRISENHPSSPDFIDDEKDVKYCECGREIYLTNELELGKCCYCIEYEQENK